MKSLRLPRYPSLAAGIAMALVYSSINLAGAAWGINSITVLFASLLLILPYVIFSQHRTLRVSRLVVWILFLLVVSISSMFYTSDLDLAIQTFIQRLLFVVVLSLFYISLSSSASVDGARVGLFLVTLFSVGMNVAGYVSPGFFSSGSRRAAGFYLNPNTSALAIVLAMTLSVRVVPGRLRFLFYLTAGIGVFLTFSRGGMLCWMVAVSLLEISRLTPKVFVRLLLLMVPVLIATLIGAKLIESGQFSNLGVLDEEFMSSRGVQRVLSITSDETFEDSRVKILGAGIRLVEQQPFIGQGIGDPVFEFGGDQPQGPHNMYLSLWIQHGIVGLLLLPLLAASILPVGRLVASYEVTAFVIILMIVCLFSHKVLTQLHYAAIIALASRMAGRTQNMSEVTVVHDSYLSRQ